MVDDGDVITNCGSLKKMEKIYVTLKGCSVWTKKDFSILF